MYCHHCGSKNDHDAKFCEKCRTELDKKHSTGSSSATGSGDESNSNLIPASSNKRLMNFILDYIFYFVFVFIIAFILGVLFVIFGLERIIDSEAYNLLLGSLLFVAYYVLFEGLFAKSPAKFITKTTVTRTDGSKPKLKQIIGRTFARLIPFEFVSFFGHNPIGWHDRLSRTRVVNDSELHSSDHKTNREIK